MPVLTPNTPLRSTAPLVRIDNKLAAGTFLFSLTVVDNSGNESVPAQLRVTVVNRTVPGPTVPGPTVPGPTITGATVPGTTGSTTGPVRVPRTGPVLRRPP